MWNAALLVCEAVLYFALMTTLFGVRGRFGIGLFFCALGTMHFLETYLASVFYVQLPGGVLLSPGSTVLFAGKLMMLLLVYLREDAVVVRQPIYGLFVGNIIIVGLVALLRLHDLADIGPDLTPDLAFVDQMGVLMVWGTVLLFLDSILIVLLYERSERWLGNRRFLRIWLSASVILTFDQFGFFAGLHLVTDAPVSALYGGWAGKMAAALVYSVMLGFYLRRIAVAGTRPVGVPLRDVFEVLTYRERYENLLRGTGRDGLTGLFDRGRFDLVAPRAVTEALAAGRQAAVLVIDIDHFKAVNDTWGHSRGDAVLRAAADAVRETVRGSDAVFRYGGEEFVVVAVDLGPAFARPMAERIRAAVRERTAAAFGRPVTVSIGLAIGPEDGRDLQDLFAEADRRLYRAKSDGRDRTVSVRAAPLPAASAGSPYAAPRLS